ncbi:MAG: sulfite exporter TauE/SafE family protein [Salinirussus sp.]
MALPPAIVAMLGGVVLAAGALTGIAGFGFAMLGTMALAMAIDPATAVVFMILPVLSVNLSLITDLSLEELHTCGRRFAPLVLAALVGSIVGIVALDVVPAAPLRVGLGLLSLGFVATTQEAIELPGRDRIEDGCFVETTPAMVGVGGISGLIFGGTNVGVQLIAYIRSCELSHSLFIGVVAMVFLGLNAIRAGAAGLLGLYPSMTLIGLSVAAAVPAVIGVAIGKRLRDRIAERHRRLTVLGLLALIGGRLLLAGLGIA